MSKTKSQVKTCVERLKVLADETRLRVIHQIMEKPLSVSEINQVLKIDQSLLSHHLKILRDSGLIMTERIGKSIFYSTSKSIISSSNKQIVDLGCCQINFKEGTTV